MYMLTHKISSTDTKISAVAVYLFSSSAARILRENFSPCSDLFHYLIINSIVAVHFSLGTVGYQEIVNASASQRMSR